jgi:glycosyltransferase involved in cell wall biosynthesis
VIVAWTPVTQRYDNLAPLLDTEFFNDRATGPTPWRYLVSSVRTVRVLERRRPKAVMVALPPFPLLAVCWVWAKLRKAKVILDLHSAVFESAKWRWARRPTMWIARRSDLTIVHHDGYLGRVPKGTVLHEVFDADQRPRSDGGFVLVPASWHEDEPIAEIYAAASALPGVEIRITGRPQEVRSSSGAVVEPPANVTLTGWVSDEEYKDLLASCSAVLALTTRENTMQAGGYQALAWHKPLVTSDTEVLRGFFGAAAVYASPNASAIRQAVEAVLAERETYAEAMGEHHQRLLEEYPAHLAPVRAAMG